MSASDAIQLAFTQTWQIVALFLVVLFAAKTIARRSVHLTHVLWLVVLVKCLVPPILSSPVGLFCWTDFSNPKAQSVSNPTTLQIVSPNPLALRPHSPKQLDGDLGVDSTDIDSDFVSTKWKQATTQVPLQADDDANAGHVFFRRSVVIWIAGVAIVFVLFLVRTVLCFHRIRKAGLAESQMLNDLVARLRNELRIERSVRILITESRIGPLVYGLFRPTILLPRLVFERSSEADLIPILTHELIHVRRGDLWINLFQNLANAIWWFNPLVWMASKNVSRVAESCCDEQTVAALGGSTAKYARSLLRILELKRSLHTVPAFPGIRPVEITSQRLERIMKLRQGCHKRTPKWCWLTMLLLTVTCIPGAVWGIDSEPASDFETNATTAPSLLNASVAPPIGSPDFSEFDVNAPQIAIEARFVSLPKNASEMIGIDWSYLQVPAKRSANKKAKRDVKSRTAKTPRRPQGRSQTVIETNEPVRFAILTEKQTNSLLASISKNRNANILQAPKVTLFNLQTASISDSCQRPFVVGFHNDDHQIQIVSEGTVIDCRPEVLQDDAVWLDLTTTYTEIRSVRESTIAKPSSSDKITVQIPEVQRTAIGVELQVPARQTLVLVGSTKQRAEKQSEQLFVIIRPEVISVDRVEKKQVTKTLDRELLDASAEVWDLSLKDCIRVAMRNSKSVVPINLNTNSANGMTLIAPLRRDVSLHDVEQTIRNRVSEVIKSYWELYFYYHNLDAAKTGRDQALLTWRQVNAKYEEGSDQVDASSVPQSQEQYFFFRGRAEEAKRDLLKAERQLRFLMGLAADGRIIRPSDKPDDQIRQFDWDEVRTETTQNSGEIKRQTQRIAEQRKEWKKQWEAIEPKIDAVQLYRFLGLGAFKKNSDFAATALDRIATDKFARDPGKALAANLEIPIGLRNDLTSLRHKQLELARSEAALEDLELEQIHSMSDAIQNLHASYKLMSTAAMQVLSASQQVEALRVQAEIGNVTLEFLLDAERRLADARVAYFQSLLQYNFSIVEVHYRKGTLLTEYKYKVVDAHES